MSDTRILEHYQMRWGQRRGQIEILRQEYEIYEALCELEGLRVGILMDGLWENLQDPHVQEYEQKREEFNARWPEDVREKYMIGPLSSFVENGAS